MFKLFKMDSNQYLILKRGVEYSGDRITTIARLLHMGVNEDDIYNGLYGLDHQDHYMADYGINLTFIYSLPYPKVS